MIETMQWIQNYGGWLVLVLLLIALLLLQFSTLSDVVSELQSLKNPNNQIIPTLYLRYTGAHYRIKIVGGINLV